ncbi:uncharacterized protein LOC112491472 [Ziziphus jujuba]|uniref:Uncharacterized protein LOC112491472 n=1 Tax=Ziziphus jujuba TaxID=326968 RepID=A0ABM4A038_ZIZJJ|nr:uncharacterized protein LOC112491472 [Ziziphus jujuba]XP_060670101.1 uncharacterized protein LOC112491472 [Ziziphus jujuba]XP_060670102.1 uncharacterized protein LOC112491472 [Ziziphus jujuba]XP_060670103.1 uncharacterized protein LOC112491472 [Ziziphus jujuba]XP_060670104.1 uncharacterized protein LOC112491472 [Ziziphus jujuba]XP_060670105.1 uncharacterized protein LOC112491472 [Ziziphus jujuba]
MATAPHNHLEMVDDLEYFNNYPWGTSSYTTTIRSLKSAFEHRESMALNMSKSYSLCGFPLAFMIWGFGTIPLLGQAFEKKLPDMAFPRILNWHISQVPRFEKATELFDHRDYPVHGLMNVTEFEHAYIGKIAWDVHHDSTPYNVAPAVRDKPPQVPLRERLTILEGEVANVRQDVKDLRITMLREFASLKTKLDKLMKHQGVGIGADGLGDGMEVDVEGDENKEEFGPDATPVDRQSRPSVVDDAGQSVTIIEKVSPSKFPARRRARKVAAAKQSIDIGRQDRKAAAAITTPYNVRGLWKKL